MLGELGECPLCVGNTLIRIITNDSFEKSLFFFSENQFQSRGVQVVFEISKNTIFIHKKTRYTVVPRLVLPGTHDL